MRVLAILHGLIGDTLMRVPALRALRDADPGVRILAIADPVSAPVLEVNPVVDEVLAWDRRNDGLARQLAHLRRVRRFRPDVALDFYFGSRTPWIAVLSGAGRRIGPAPTRTARWLLTDPLPWPFPPDQHMLDRFAALVGPLGAGPVRREWEFPVHPDVTERMRERVGEVREDDLVFVAGAGDESKRLDPDLARRFLAGLGSGTGRRILLVLDQRDPTVGADLAATEGVQRLPALPLPELGALFREVALVAVGDTGPLHIALGTAPRVLTWYQSTDPAVHRADREGTRWLYREVCEWQPCDARMTHLCKLECTRSLGVEDLLAATDDLLAAPGWRAPGLPARDPLVAP